MDAKLLTDAGLKAILSKHKIKDNGLERALATYDKLEDEAHDDCLETIAQIGKLAAALKKIKEVAANKAVTDYLDDVMDAADAEEKEVSKAKSEAEKTEAAHQKKTHKEEEEGGEDEEEGKEEEEEEGEYADRLLGAFRKLKSMGGKPMKFVVCEARPFCGLMVAKRISPKHKEELTELTGGSKKFLQIGECHFENDAYVFTSEQSVPGLARRLQKAVKNYTGKKFKFAHGGETVEEEDDEQDEEQSVAAADAPKASSATAPTPPVPEPPALAKAPEVWRKTLATISAKIDQLKAAALKEFGTAEPATVEEVKKLVSRFDGVLFKLDHSLADSLAKAHAAQDPTARDAELKNSKRILTEFLQHVKSDELIAHIDANPFGVSTQLKQNLAEGLKHMAEAIGKSAPAA